MAGCNCPLVYLAAGKGGQAYMSISSFSCEDQCDLCFFKGSWRRKGILTEYLKFVELDWENFVRYVKTRWLSLQQCCDKEVIMWKKYPALKSKFLSRIEKETIDKGNSRGETNEGEKRLSIKFKRLKTAYEDHLTEVQLLFYTACLLLFTSYNFFCRELTPSP